MKLPLFGGSNQENAGHPKKRRATRIWVSLLAGSTRSGWLLDLVQGLICEPTSHGRRHPVVRARVVLPGCFVFFVFFFPQQLKATVDGRNPFRITLKPGLKPSFVGICRNQFPGCFLLPIAFLCSCLQVFFAVRLMSVRFLVHESTLWGICGGVRLFWPKSLATGSPCDVGYLKLGGVQCERCCGCGLHRQHYPH